MKIGVMGSFRRDAERMKQKGKDMEKLKELTRKLQADIPLEQRYKLHKLKGKFKGQYECHLEDDWLVIYEIDKRENILILIRTGSHDDLGLY